MAVERCSTRPLSIERYVLNTKYKRGEYIHWIEEHHALPMKRFDLRTEGDLISQAQLDLFLEFSL